VSDFNDEQGCSTVDTDQLVAWKRMRIMEHSLRSEYSFQAVGAFSGSLLFRTQLQLEGERLLHDLLAHYRTGLLQYSRTLGIRSQQELDESYTDGRLLPISNYIYKNGWLRLNAVVETTLQQMAIDDRSTLATLRSIVGLCEFALNLPYEPSSDPGLYFLESVKILEKHLNREGLLIRCDESDHSFTNSVDSLITNVQWRRWESETILITTPQSRYLQVA
jgi:hypothetical protein